MSERNTYGLEWEPTEYESDGIDFLGWSELTPEQCSEDPDILLLDAGKIHVALPKDICIEEGFVEIGEDGEVNQLPGLEQDVWTFFANHGDEIQTIRETYSVRDVECTGSVDFKEFDRIVKERGEEPLKPGERCLADYDLVFKDKNPMEGVVIPYERFLERIPELMAEHGVRQLETKDREGNVVKGIKVVFGNPRIEFADTAEEWGKEYGASGTFGGNCDHRLFCSMSIQTCDPGTGKYKEIYQDPGVKIADIPAMNPENGLFLHNGNEYAIAMEADPLSAGRRIETAGMFLEKLLKRGVSDMCANMLETIKNMDLDAFSISERLKDRNSKDMFSADKYIKEMMAGGEEYQDRWRRVGDGDAAPVARMRIPLTVLIPKPYGIELNSSSTLPKLRISTLESEDVIEPLDDLGDSYARSNGKKITGKFVLGLAARITDDGIPCMPFYRVKDGKVQGRGTENVVWLPVHEVGVIDLEKVKAFNAGDYNAEDKVIRWLTEGMETADQHLLAHPEDFREDGGSMFTDSKGRVVIREKAPMLKLNDSEQVLFNRYKPVSVKDVDLVLIDKKCQLAPGSAANSSTNQIDATRNAIAESNSNQASPALAGSKVAAVGPRMSKSPELTYGKYSRAEFDGVVESIEKGPELDGMTTYKTMTIRSEEGRRQIVDMSERRYGGTAYVYRQVPSDGIEVGKYVRKGDVLTDAPGIINGQGKVGEPTIIALLPAGAMLNDDSILMRKSHADSYKIEVREEWSKELVVDPGTSPFGPDILFNPLKGRDPEKGNVVHGLDCSKLGDDGIVPDGTTVNPGDIIAYRLVPQKTKKTDMGEQRIMKAFGSNGEADQVPDGYKVDPIRYEGDVPGTIRTFRKKSGVKGMETLVWSVTSVRSAKTGDKFSDNGVKGTIVVVPDEDFYYIAQNAGAATGKQIDVIMGPLSYGKRKNLASIAEGVAAFVGLTKQRMVDIPNGTRNIVQGVKTMLKEAGLAEDGMVRIASRNKKVPLQDIRATVIVSNIMNCNHASYVRVGEKAKESSRMREYNLNALGNYGYTAASRKDNLGKATTEMMKEGIVLMREAPVKAVSEKKARKTGGFLRRADKASRTIGQ